MMKLDDLFIYNKWYIVSETKHNNFSVIVLHSCLFIPTKLIPYLSLKESKEQRIYKYISILPSVMYVVSMK